MDLDLPRIERVISRRLEENSESHSRPDLDPTLARVVVTNYVHMRLCKLDYTSPLQLLYGLDNLWGNGARRQSRSRRLSSKTY